MNLTRVDAHIFTRQHFEDVSLSPFPFYIVRKGHAQVIQDVNFTGNEYKSSLEQQPNKVKLFQVTTFPTVVYTTPKDGGHQILLRLEGLAITEKAAAKSLLFLNGLSTDGQGNYRTKEGEIWTPIHGLGLFDVPTFIWKGLALFGAYLTASEKKEGKKLAYGALTAASTFKAFN